MNFVITQWHKENPNDWVAILSKPQTYTNDLDDPAHHKLVARAGSLKTLRKKLGTRNDVTLSKAWGLGISKDYPLTTLQ